MKIILASQSPRRKSLLSRLGLEFDAIPSDFEEYFDESRLVKDVVEELGMGKVLDVAKKHPEAIVIGGDTIVVVDGKQLGKPEDPEEAKEMLRGYSNRDHQVISSVAVVCLDKGYQKVSSNVSTISFSKFDEELIERYVATGDVYDKAGGYAIQHPMLRPLVNKIEGRIDTIIGMPTNLAAEFLRDFDIDVQSIDLTNEDLLQDKAF